MDYLSECASNIELMEYNGIIRSERVASKDSSEQGAYFCAVPKLSYTCIGEAFPLLLIHDLYDSQGWEKDKPPFNNFNKTEWKNLLRTNWIPEYYCSLHFDKEPEVGWTIHRNYGNGVTEQRGERGGVRHGDLKY